MIRLRGLSKLYATEEIETAALRDVDLAITEGEYVTVMGPSGCGKSTLLNILGLIDEPSSGEFLFMGEEMSRATERQRAKVRKENIGFVFQSFNLIDELTVYENIELPLLYLGWAPEDRKARVEDVMEQMEISARARHFPQQLSGGQQQRAAVSRAIVARPRLILADEPTGNLDSVHGEEVIRLIGELHAAGTTIVMVTHSPEYARVGDRTVRLRDGQIVSEAEGAGVD